MAVSFETKNYQALINIYIDIYNNNRNIYIDHIFVI